jgi:hypothetical protein
MVDKNKFAVEQPKARAAQVELPDPEELPVGSIITDKETKRRFKVRPRWWAELAPAKE